MTQAPAKHPLKHLRASDLRAMAQLATQATSGVTQIMEGVHQSVRDTLGMKGGASPGQTGGLTGLFYRSVQGVNRMVGKGMDTALVKLLPVLAPGDVTHLASPEREAVLAVLNGVLGDRLAAEHNILATPMTMRYQGQALNGHTLPAMPDASGKILLLIHGLCMNDLQWQTSHDKQPVNHGTSLSKALGYTPVYLRYNSGLHTSQNGHELARQLTQLVNHWPVPVEEITVVAHSMGGLLTRSALHDAQQTGQVWPRCLKNIVFLGTPHHGAPLERAGNWIDVILNSTPFSAPFAKLGQLRSAGITDFRYGHLLDSDWQNHNRFHRQPDSQEPLLLPEGVACYTVAATLSAQRGQLADRLMGDGLVPLPSALGQHEEPKRSLVFAKDAQHIAYRTGHMALLSRPEVAQQMVQWLTPRT